VCTSSPRAAGVGAPLALPWIGRQDNDGTGVWAADCASAPPATYSGWKTKLPELLGRRRPFPRALEKVLAPELPRQLYPLRDTPAVRQIAHLSRSDWIAGVECERAERQTIGAGEAAATKQYALKPQCLLDLGRCKCTGTGPLSHACCGSARSKELPAPLRKPHCPRRPDERFASAPTRLSRPNAAPLIGERAATRGRVAMEGGDEHA
jgi:hypothetical protein